VGIEQIADRVIEKDVLVIGTEAAGGVAAIAASESADVLMVTKGACYVCMSSSELHTTVSELGSMPPVGSDLAKAVRMVMSPAPQ